MKRILSLTVLLFVFSFTIVEATDSSWYWISVPSDPDAGYFIEEDFPKTIGQTPSSNTSSGNRTVVPEGFIQILEEVDNLEECSQGIESAISKLRKFDSDNNFIVSDYPCDMKCSPYYTAEAVVEREKLLKSINDGAQQCKEDVIQKAIQKEEDEKRLKQINQAVEECDFDFFEKMTSSEKMDTYDERVSCEEMYKDQSVEPQPKTDEPISMLVPEPVVAQYLPPAPPIELTAAPEGLEVEQVMDANVTTAPEATTTKEEITVSQEELDRMVEEKLNEKLSEAEPEPQSTSEPEPSFFKKVTNFLFGWLF
jgi:hypothetical protein